MQDKEKKLKMKGDYCLKKAVVTPPQRDAEKKKLLFFVSDIFPHLSFILSHVFTT
jgi:hypothetical protein